MITNHIGRNESSKLALSIKWSNLWKGNNDTLLWFKADSNKIPVLAKYKIPVDTGQLKIVSATGLKN